MLDVWQWALAAGGALLVGISKTGIGGLGILAVALLAIALPARESVGTVLLLLIVGDIVAVSTYRREANWRHLVRLFPWAAVGIVVGALALNRVSNTNMSRLIGAILLVLVVVQLARRRAVVANNVAHPNPWVAMATGLAAGFTTMVANAAAPIMTIYLLAMDLPKLAFVGTTAWYFFAVNLFKVPFSYGLGLLNGASFGAGLALAPLVVLGALLGRRLLDRIDQQTFELVALVLTVVASLRLLLA